VSRGTTRFETLRYAPRDGVVELALDRPAEGNAFTARLLAELAEAAGQLATEPGLRAVVLRGEGKDFCLGASVGMFVETPQVERPALVRELVTQFNAAITALARAPAPVLGVAHGFAIGGGVSLLAACDVVLAADDAKFRLAWTGLGLSMDGGASSLLPRILGPRRTLELIHTNRLFSAAEAHAWGFANWLAPAAELSARTKVLAQQLATGPTLAHAANKRLVLDGHDRALEAQLEDEAQAITALAGTRDVEEGCRAFVEKRRAQFEGR
jgi:2-(1,2-epoxy-1,2-dihydrophenyl)acetyl-CoA isomerase